MSEATEQSSDLARLYATYGDDELRSLAHTFNDLTEPAQHALKAELASRGVPMPGASAPKPAPEPDSPECVFEFAGQEDAVLAQSVLRSAGIESLVPSSEFNIDTARLIVPPDDANSARLILARNNLITSAEDEDGAEASAEATFVEPVCPQCGTTDPLLESVEPTNQWRCEACDHIWSDPQPDLEPDAA